MPLRTKDSIHQDNEPIEVPPSTSINLSRIPSLSALLPFTEASKKRKQIELLTSPIQAMNLDDFEFEEVILKDTVVLNTHITYFDEGFFG